MNGEQLSLDMPRRTALGREDFFVSNANVAALAMLDNWRAWPVPRLALAGPTGSGKSHLAQVWATESGALIVDISELTDLEAKGFDTGQALVIENADQTLALEPKEIDRVERALLHVHNALGEAGTPLVLTGREPPARWAIGLLDLASRLAAMPVARIEAPDAALLEAILVKLFADRQINVTPDLIAYLLARIDRSAIAAQRVVDVLDKQSLQQRRPVTRPFASDILRRLGLIAEPS